MAERLDNPVRAIFKDLEDREVIRLAEDQIQLLSRTGFDRHKWRMSVPPNKSDHDILFGEVCLRFRECLDGN